MKKLTRLKWAIAGAVLASVIFLGGMLWLDLRHTRADAPGEADGEELALPEIKIELDGVTLDELNDSEKSVKYGGNKLILSEGNSAKEYSGVEIKGRGNSTWAQSKKPYQIKFTKRENFLDMGKERKWVMLADYFDASHLRNDVAFYLAGMLDMEYTARGRFAEVVVDESELGLYYITNRVAIDKNSVDLRDPFGILVEMDNLHGTNTECYRTGEESCIVVQDLVDEANLEPAVRDFLKAFDQLEIAARKGDYATVSKVIDVESFAKYYLLSEFTVDPDAYTTSWFLYKDGSTDKIHAGPGWDFDLALGNREWTWTDDKAFHSPDETMVRRKEAMAEGEKRDMKTSRVMYYLIEIPEFQAEVMRIYNIQMAGRYEELAYHMMKTATRIAPAAELDNEKWERGDYYEEVDYLSDWIRKRYLHFETEYGNL